MLCRMHENEVLYYWIPEVLFTLTAYYYTTMYSSGFVLADRYICGSSIGGLYRGRDEVTGFPIAIKIVPKELINEGEFSKIDREKHILKRVGLLKEFLESRTKYYFIMNCSAEGQTLEKYVTKLGGLTEGRARKVFKEIVSVIASLHNKGITHRDIHPKNIQISHPTNVKLLNYTTACEIMNNVPLTEVPRNCYTAPELNNTPYFGEPLDVYQMGVTLLFLLTQSSDLSVLSKSCLSKEAIHLINRCTESSPEDRITIPEIISHPWLLLLEFIDSDEDLNESDEPEEESSFLSEL